MTPDEIKTLRKELECTAKELAGVLGVEQATVFAWERGELFPTKRYVDQMVALRAAGAGAVPKTPKTRARGAASVHPSAPLPRASGSPLDALADPILWQIVRKVIAHPSLWEDVTRLAVRYTDPASPSPSLVPAPAVSGRGGSGTETDGDG